MFCSMCGRKLNVGGNFCTGCGVKIGQAPTSKPSQATSTPTSLPNKKIMIIISIFAFIALLTIVWFTSVGRGGLRGTWTDDFGNSIVFRGNRFSINICGYYTFNRRGVSNIIPTRFTGLGTLRGTYTISDNQIELIYGDGQTRNLPFSRDGNTIIINNIRFVRR